MDVIRRELDRYYRQAEFWIYNWPRRKQEIERERQEIILSSPPLDFHAAPSGKSLMSDQTGRRAAKLADLSARDWRWVRFMEQVEAKLNDDQRKLVALRRHLGRSYGRRNALRAISYRMHYSTRRLREMWRQIVYFVAFEAVANGLIRGDDESHA